MKIDGDRFVEALSLPSYDKKVLSLLKELGLKRPMKDENYNYVSVNEVTSDEKVEFGFNEKLKTLKQKKGFYKNVDFFLQGITVGSDDKFSPPMGIKWDNSYERVKKEIGKKADFKDEEGRYKRKLWLLEDQEKKYFLNISFNNEFSKIMNFTLIPHDDKVKYIMPKNEE
jgi:hypothetical protein